MEKEEFNISKKDKELEEILQSKPEEQVGENTSIDIPLPKDRNKLKKGIALATAAVIGTVGMGYTSAKVRKDTQDAIKQTENIIYEESTYTESEINFEKPYIKKGKIVKTSYEVEASAYVQVFQETSLPEVKNDITTYNFETPELSKSLYIPETDIITYIPLDVNIDDPSKECTNLRMTPRYEKDNVIKKLQKGESIYIKPGPVKRDEDECWFEAIYPEDESLIYGYYCVVDKENENKYIEYTKDNDVFFYSYVLDDSRLYTKDEMLNMYYRVEESNGLPFSKKAGDYENFTYIPYGSIVEGTTNTDIRKANNEDPYLWIQCIADIDGEKQLGYIPYKKIMDNPLLKRVPSEDLYKTKDTKTR